ncbi:C39 family peptidase [Acidipropionibacterium jensenii]|uniref:C39 family peptidase n=1 Tax=Acidipropionibacterium jensenii TaxID=1749 RepID=UPI000BC33418|nr:C39 family peptidase [Acidipropionibacterium jensenii]
MPTPMPADQIEFHAWQAHPAETAAGRQAFADGDHDGTRVGDLGLTVDHLSGPVAFTDPFVDTPDGEVTRVADAAPVDYRCASWTSPLHSLGLIPDEIIVSWNARTPGRSWIEVQIQPWATTPDTTQTPSSRTGDGDVVASPADTAPASWFTMARWCEKLPAQGGGIHRASVDGQADDVAVVDTDTLRARGTRPITGYRLRVTLFCPADESELPVVSLLGAVASRTPTLTTPEHLGEGAPTDLTGTGTSTSTSTSTSTVTPGPTSARDIEVPVPTLSQMTHRGQYPQWGGGGGSWCSATSVAMVMTGYQVGPSPEDLAWVKPADDAIVPFSARATWDHQYGGAGNWAFSAAYPAEYGLTTFVTRLASVAQMEPFIAAGVPLAASVSFDAAELDGAGYSTEGHLLVVVGFTDRGDVVVNDPASHELADNDQVRVVYRRDQFERVWLSGSAGTVYVIAAPGTALPAGPSTGL